MFGGKSMVKTNAMRILDKQNISYQVYEYEVDENDLSGVSTAKKINQPCEILFKTLVVKNEKKINFVCCIPVAEELDLKRIARYTKSKSVEMLHVKELLPTCGYVRGSCSPIGMKKKFPTYIDETCILYDEIFVSGGMKGIMLKIKTSDLLSFCEFTPVELCK